MKVLVDEIPKSEYECLFNGWKFGRECMFGGGKCKLDGKCSYLKIVDTKAFYTDEEMAIEKEISTLRKQKHQIKTVLDLMEKYYR